MKTRHSIRPPASGAPRVRILILDTDDATRQAEARLVKCGRFIVDTAGDLTAAWRRLCGTHYGLLIANSQLRGHGGRDLGWWLYEAGVTAPVILTRGTVPVGVINPAGKPASWFASLGRQYFRRGGLLPLVRRILPAAATHRRHPVAA